MLFRSSHHLGQPRLIPEIEKHRRAIGRADFIRDREVEHGLRILFQGALEFWNHSIDLYRMATEEVTSIAVERQGSSGRGLLPLRRGRASASTAFGPERERVNDG